MSLVSSTLGREFSGTGTQTLADWVSQKLARPPEAGETVQVEGLTIMARKLRRKKIYEAIISL